MENKSGLEEVKRVAISGEATPFARVLAYFLGICWASVIASFE
jgi:hypothetical protein